MAPATPESASIDPTERSMPADEITNVIPIARTPNTEVESRMLRILETERKAFDSIAIVTQRTASTMSEFEPHRGSAGEAPAPGSRRGAR